MLYIEKDSVEVCKEKGICHVCRKRVSTWMARIRTDDGEGDKAPFCAWCLMYSNEAQWGHDNREELLHVGRFALGMAAAHKKPLPHLDERDRLHPSDAEKFIMGVSFTSQVVVGSMVARLPEDARE